MKNTGMNESADPKKLPGTVKTKEEVIRVSGTVMQAIDV